MDNTNNEAELERKSIRMFMEENGLTVNGWCKRAGIRESTLRGFLNSDKNTSMQLSTVRKLAQAMNVTIDSIINFEVDNNKRTITLIDMDALKLIIKDVLLDAENFKSKNDVKLTVEQIATIIAGRYQAKIIKQDFPKNKNEQNEQKFNK